MRLLPLLLVIAACGTEVSKEAPVSALPVKASANATLPVAVDTVPKPIQDTLTAAPAAMPARIASPTDDGCAEYINATANGVELVCYTRPERMAAREADLPGMLESAWQLAWQGAPRSIADDFERGISTEHVHMPDTLDVEVKHYRDCNAREPHAVMLYRVWTNTAGQVGWRSR
ncbi:MAG: hypothetical protein R2817_07565 [Flavobacteriales bacterium]